MLDPQPTLYSERLTLRPFTIVDATDVQRLAGSRAIADTTLRIPHPYPDGAAEEWIRTHAPGYESRTQATFALVPRVGGPILGCIGLLIDADNEAAELGYWVGEFAWGQGFATEGGRALLHFAFGKLDLHRIHARHLVRNPASGHVMQKLGMTLEGVHRHAVRKWGVYEDVAHYGILATDWSRGAPAP